MECREAMEKSSRYIDGELSFWDCLKIKLHLNHCWSCNRFVQQLPLLGQVARRLHESDHPCPGEPLPPDTRDRLKKILADASSKKESP